MRKSRIIAAVGGAVAVVAIVAACGVEGTGKIDQQYQDAPVESRNDNPAIVGTMPDGFSNFASKCDGPNRVYVAFKGDQLYASIDVVPNDPRCTDGTEASP